MERQLHGILSLSFFLSEKKLNIRRTSGLKKVRIVDLTFFFTYLWKTGKEKRQGKKRSLKDLVGSLQPATGSREKRHSHESYDVQMFPAALSSPLLLYYSHVWKSESACPLCSLAPSSKQTNQWQASPRKNLPLLRWNREENILRYIEEAPHVVEGDNYTHSGEGQSIRKELTFVVNRDELSKESTHILKKNS